MNENPQVQKALRRLAAEMAPTSLSQLVMWRSGRRFGLGYDLASFPQIGPTIMN